MAIYVDRYILGVRLPKSRALYHGDQFEYPTSDTILRQILGEHRVVTVLDADSIKIGYVQLTEDPYGQLIWTYPCGPSTTLEREIINQFGISVGDSLRRVVLCWRD